MSLVRLGKYPRMEGMDILMLVTENEYAKKHLCREVTNSVSSLTELGNSQVSNRHLEVVR